ncbi:MAG: bacterial Ig-like domain-containing protein [Dehalobacterium sp.]
MRGTAAVSRPANSNSSIDITAPPTKTTYTVEDTLDLSGMVVTANYSDGSQQVIANRELKVTGFDSSEPEADQVITVTYEEKEATFKVNIIP